MNITITLLGQLITFALFVWFTMKFVWPPIMKALHDRQKTIADGLADAERGRQELEMARKQAREIVQEAKGQASILIEKANERAHRIHEEAQLEARNVAERMKRLAEQEIERSALEMRKNLEQEVVLIAMKGAEKLIRRNLDTPANQELIHDVVKELQVHEAG